MARRKRYRAETERQALKRANDLGEGEAIVRAWVRHVTG